MPVFIGPTTLQTSHIFVKVCLMGWLYRFLDWIFTGDDPDPVVPPSPSPQPIPTPPIPQPTPQPAPTINESFLALLNPIRQSAGLSPLSSDPKLIALAQSWSESQASVDSMSHGNFSGRINSIYPNVYAAENVAMGFPDVQRTFNQWMNSPPHKTNMMGDYAICGLGRSVSSSGNCYWTMDVVKI